MMHDVTKKCPCLFQGLLIIMFSGPTESSVKVNWKSGVGADISQLDNDFM